MTQRTLFDLPEELAPAPLSCTLRLGRWQDVLSDVTCDALITDTPYSARTHKAHKDMAKLSRAELSYEAFSPDDVRDFVGHWAPRTRGWFVALTDHVLAPIWEAALAATGRNVFSPLACVEIGSRVRLAGDGPSQWSVWAIAARPRARAFSRWGSLPGAYVTPKGQGARSDGPDRMMGGKSLWLMQSLIRDYSRAGDLVCDPCAGTATTLLAARSEERSAIGAEAHAARFELAERRLSRRYTLPLISSLHK